MSHTCKQPDRDEPRMVCGYPLPCPYHTMIADVTKQTVSIPVGRGATLTVPAESAGRVGKIVKALRPKGRS